MPNRFHAVPGLLVSLAHRAVDTAGVWTPPIRFAVCCGQLAGSAPALNGPSRFLLFTSPQQRRTCPHPLDNGSTVAHSDHSPDDHIYIKNFEKNDRLGLRPCLIEPFSDRTSLTPYGPDLISATEHHGCRSK